MQLVIRFLCFDLPNYYNTSILYLCFVIRKYEQLLQKIDERSDNFWRFSEQFLRKCGATYLFSPWPTNVSQVWFEFWARRHVVWINFINAYSHQAPRVLLRFPLHFKYQHFKCKYYSGRNFELSTSRVFFKRTQSSGQRRFHGPYPIRSLQHSGHMNSIAIY